MLLNKNQQFWLRCLAWGRGHNTAGSPEVDGVELSLGEKGWKALGARPADPQYPNQLFAASIHSKSLAFLCLQCEALCRLLCARTARAWSPFSPSQSLLNREESSQGLSVRIFPPRAQIPSSCQEHDVKALPNRWFFAATGFLHLLSGQIVFLQQRRGGKPELRVNSL